MKNPIQRSLGIVPLVFAITALALPAQAASPRASLSLAQAASNERVMKLPVCSETVSSNCRKAGPNATWIVVGLAAAGLIIASVTSANDQPPKPVSP